MAFPTAGGHPQLSGIHIPTLYLPQILLVFYMSTVFNAIANTDYQGEITREGDTVIIPTMPEAVIYDAPKGGSPGPLQLPAPGSIQLLIDRAKGFQIGVESLDLQQANMDFWPAWVKHYGARLAEAIDRDVLATIYAEVHAANTGATAGAQSGSYNLGVAGAPLVLTASNILTKLTEMWAVLREQEVPEEDNYVVLPHWALQRLMDSDLKNAAFIGGPSSLRNGLYGELAGFKLYGSSNLRKSVDGGSGKTVWNALFGQKSALSFAATLKESDVQTVQGTFIKALLQRYVYGFKVVQPKALGHALIAAA